MMAKQNDLDMLSEKVQQYPYIACKAWEEEEYEMLPSLCFLPWIEEHAIFAGHGLRVYKREEENFFRVEILDSLEDRVFDMELSSGFQLVLLFMIIIVFWRLFL